MTMGEFFLALAKLKTKYEGASSVHYVLISKHANENGLYIDEEGPYGEQEEILRPLKSFLESVVSKKDVLWQIALALLAWEAYQQYLEHRRVRIHGRAHREQFERRYAHRQ